VARLSHTRRGTFVDLGPALAQRAQILSAQLDREILAALNELGEQVAIVFAGQVMKAGRPSLFRLVNRVLAALNLRQWIEQRLMPILRNHAVRVMMDTRRMIETEIGLEFGLAEEDVQRIADSAGEHLGLRDIEPQVRESILHVVQEAVAAGENPVKTSQRIRALVPAGRFVRAGARYRALLIAQTETANLQRATALALYESNPNVTHVRLRDGIYGPPRSDSECIARNGQIVPIEDAAAVHPFHPRCTLGFEPVVSGVALQGSAELIQA
jgi:hypothetical protein